MPVSLKEYYTTKETIIMTDSSPSFMKSVTRKDRGHYIKPAIDGLGRGNSDNFKFHQVIAIAILHDLKAYVENREMIELVSLLVMNSWAAGKSKWFKDGELIPSRLENVTTCLHFLKAGEGQPLGLVAEISSEFWKIKSDEKGKAKLSTTEKLPSHTQGFSLQFNLGQYILKLKTKADELENFK